MTQAPQPPTPNKKNLQYFTFRADKGGSLWYNTPSAERGAIPPASSPFYPIASAVSSGRIAPKVRRPQRAGRQPKLNPVPNAAAPSALRIVNGHNDF